ncbi:uncharacterized protein ISCGN_014600 [Ixodes scapularis]
MEHSNIFFLQNKGSVVLHMDFIALKIRDCFVHERWKWPTNYFLRKKGSDELGLCLTLDRESPTSPACNPRRKALYSAISPAMEVVKSLAALLKDSPASLIEKEEDHVQPAFPVMQVRGGASSSPLTVVLEDCSFEVTDIVAGIALILALYWVHDISCCPKASWSLAVIGNFIGLTYKTKSFLVLDLI